MAQQLSFNGILGDLESKLWAAADKLRNELLGAALDQWEAEDGPFTQAELDEAASRLGLAPRSDVA